MRASSKTTNKPEPDALPSMVDPREAMTVSCDHPRDLLSGERVPVVHRPAPPRSDTQKKCRYCPRYIPKDGPRTCLVCRERQRRDARNGGKADA